MKWAYHEPDGNPCRKCGLTRARHRVRHAPGCACGASHKGARSRGEKARGRARRRYTIGLDGEGMGSAPHRYTLLAWSDSEGRRSGYVEDTAGLDTERCLAFLAALPVDAHVCGYYLAYDWTMILRDLPNVALYRLFRPGLRKRPKTEGGGFSPVRWRGYHLHWLGGMMRVKRGRGEWVTVWDVGKFYQCPFVQALEDAGIDAGDIPAMKKRRAEFGPKDAEKVRAYCLDECAKLAQLVEQLDAAHRAADLPLRTWYGPGSAATVMLDAWGIRKKRGEIPDAMRLPVACAFFGGRFEHGAFGRIAGPTYGADIVSAYPAECVRLPCLEHARWEWSEREADLDGAEQACVRFELATTRSKRAWGPLPVRAPDGTIVFPRSGASGWSWLVEYRAARRWSQVRFRGAWILRRDCDCAPFAGIAELFDARLRAGKKSAVGGALKRCYNSGYGKLAQSVGDPPFRSQAWAGMITSGCRARLLDVLWRYDGDVLAVATDGVYSRVPLDVDRGAGLGQWECDEYPGGIVLVRPGIYWTESDVRSRGLPRTLISAERAAILGAIERGEPGVRMPDIRQFGGARACIYLCPDGRIRRAPRYGEWYERPARISFDPRPKRQPDWGLWELPGVESQPYRPGRSPAGAALRAAEILGEGCQ